MSSRRQPSIPPRIPGYDFVRLLGMGGFADVFEYRQELPRRSVAVKVLLSGSLDQDAREAFFAEANVMAQLSHHPSIVTVYHADIAADGRPYLVMEYCSRPGLGSRYRMERFTVAEVLRTGIRVASAVEAAHHLGILHRDIKPANILATDFGWPALTDFGIASTLGSSTAATGMSIPWSAPELLAEQPGGDARGDVYSLGATIYSLLVGHSPFEIPGRSNSPADLLSRIERSPLPPIDREDVPPSLAAVLARAMAKDPERRFLSALALAHALQQVERSMHLPVTSIDLSQDAIPDIGTSARTNPLRPGSTGGTGAVAQSEPETAVDQATRLRPVVSIDPHGAPAPSRPATPRHADEEATRLRPIVSIPAQTAPEPSAPEAPADVPHPGYLQPGSPDEGFPDAGGGPGGWTGVPAPQPQPERTFATPRGSKFAPTADEIRSQHYRKGAGLHDANTGGGSTLTKILVAGASLVVVGALVVVGVLTLGGDGEPNALESTTPSVKPTVAPQATVPSPAQLLGQNRGDGTAEFTWANPDPLVGDTYSWRIVKVGDMGAAQMAEEETVVVPIPDGDTSVCIQVSIVRENRAASTEPVEGCSR